MFVPALGGKVGFTISDRAGTRKGPVALTMYYLFVGILVVPRGDDAYISFFFVLT